MLAQAIDAEVDDWITRHSAVKDQQGRQLVVRNGHHPTRTLVTGVGPIEVIQPRVLDRRIARRRKVEVAPGQTVTEDIDAAGRPGEPAYSRSFSEKLYTGRALSALRTPMGETVEGDDGIQNFSLTKPDR